MIWERKKRVRIHLADRPGVDVPRVDGLLVSRRRREFLIALPELVLAAEGNPVTPEGRLVGVPRENVLLVEYL